jgi:hypothetical protein
VDELIYQFTGTQYTLESFYLFAFLLHDAVSYLLYTSANVELLRVMNRGQ